jgi:hypothetical protein
MGLKDKLAPFGILNMMTGLLTIIFGVSFETSDFTATQSIIKTQQSDLQPFYSEHTLASPGLESAVLRYHGRKSVRGLLESCKG